MFLRVLLPSLLLSASAFADSDSVVIRYLEPQNQVEKTAKSDI